jgi:hypothetical protein
MDKTEEKDPTSTGETAPGKKTLTRREALKRIALGAGIGIAGITLGAKAADASKHCCIAAYPDYNYQDYGGYGDYSSYGYSSWYNAYYSHNDYYSNSHSSGNSYNSYYAYSSGNYYTSYS